MMEGRDSFTMIPAAAETHLPQRLDKIMATLHDRLASDVEVQDYHFLVDPADRGQITLNGFPQLDQLEKAFPHGNISIYFNPTTGEMSVSTLGKAAQVELQHLFLTKIRHCIAAHPQVAGSLYISPFLWEPLESKVPNCLVVVHPLHHDGKEAIASFTISFSAIGNKKKTAKSTLAHVMTRYPNIQTMIRLDLGGLATDIPANNDHHERRIQRIADLSSVVTWTRDGYGKVVNTSEKLSKEGGELRLRLGGGNQGGVEVVVKYSEILNAIRMGGRIIPLGGVAAARDDAPSPPLQSSMVPLFFPFPGRHHRFPTSSGMNIGAVRAARLLGLGDTANTTTPTSAELGGREGAGMFRPRPYTANRGGIAGSLWIRLLVSLLHKR